MQATMRARALPPRESMSSLVSLESLYGMWGTAVGPDDSRSARAEMTCVQAVFPTAHICARKPC